MGTNETQAISDVVNKTSSELILFFVLITVLLLILTVPIIKLLMDGRKKGRDQDIKEQKLLIDVIRGNSEVMSQLKTVLESTNSNCARCKAEQLACFKRLEDKQGNEMIVLTEIKDMLKALL